MKKLLSIILLIMLVPIYAMENNEEPQESFYTTIISEEITDTIPTIPIEELENITCIYPYNLFYLLS